MLIAIALAIDDYTRVSEIVSIVTGGADGNSFSSYANASTEHGRSSASGSGAGRARAPVGSSAFSTRLSVHRPLGSC